MKVATITPIDTRTARHKNKQIYIAVVELLIINWTV